MSHEKKGTEYNSHELKEYEVDASKRGADYFSKKYGETGDPKYRFDYNSFVTGGYSPYINPRTGRPNQDKNPVTNPNKSSLSFFFGFI